MAIETAATKERLRVALILALNAGFIDAFCFFNYDARFAGAQTGNLIQAGIYLAQRQWVRVADFVIPIGFFVVGVMFRVIMSDRLAKSRRFDVLYLLLIQLLGMTVFSLLYPTVLSGIPNSLAVGILSFLMAIQYDTFKKAHGQAYGSIFMTGNIRTFSVNLAQFVLTREPKYRQNVTVFSFLIGSFFIGAVIATFASRIFGTWTLLGSSFFLILVYLIFRFEG